jgi:hypothetical protein
MALLVHFVTNLLRVIETYVQWQLYNTTGSKLVSAVLSLSASARCFTVPPRSSVAPTDSCKAILPATFIIKKTRWIQRVPENKTAAVTGVTRLRAGQLTKLDSKPGRRKTLPLLQNVHATSGAYPASYLMDTTFLPGSKAAEAWSKTLTSL